MIIHSYYPIGRLKLYFGQHQALLMALDVSGSVIVCPALAGQGNVRHGEPRRDGGRRGHMKSGLGVLAWMLAIVVATAHAGVAPGTVIDKSTAAQVKDLLPPEIFRHYETGEYKNPVVDFPDAKFRW